MANSLKFGTSGLRGLATELVGAESRRHAAAFVASLRRSGPVRQVLVGRDLRASSAEIFASVVAGLNGVDVEAIDCGELPTPALALEAMRLKLPAIMITGSHIPADRNGLKFYSAVGEIDKAEEQGIVEALGEAPDGRAGQVKTSDALDRYVQRYAGMIAGGLGGLRVGVWQHSGVARELLVDVIEAAGATVVPLGRSDVFVPVDTEAISAELATQLADWVREHRLGAIVSTDGDADRPLVVDENGTVLRGDVVGTLTARFLDAESVVTPVTSNSAIESTGWFGRVVRTKVGSPFVIAGMAGAPGRVVGFEANGGVLLGSDVDVGGAHLVALPTRDALLPILAVLAFALRERKTLSQLAAMLPPRHARSDRLEHVPQEKSAALLARLRTGAAGYFAPVGTIVSVSDIDGLRYELASGDVVHYRPSGNAPELRCYTEAATAGRADELLAWGLKAAEAVVR